jgi:hypothetical protein
MDYSIFHGASWIERRTSISVSRDRDLDIERESDSASFHIFCNHGQNRTNASQTMFCTPVPSQISNSLRGGIVGILSIAGPVPFTGRGYTLPLPFYNTNVEAVEFCLLPYILVPKWHKIWGRRKPALSIVI